MKTEQLIAKKVKHHFNKEQREVLFEVTSLKEHFDGLLIHTSDVVYITVDTATKGYVKAADVNMDDAVSKEFVEEPISETIYQGGMKNPFEWKDGVVDSEAVLKIEVTAETLEDNPDLVAEGVEVGEIITVDAVEPIEEIIPAKVDKKKRTKKQ